MHRRDYGDTFHIVEPEYNANNEIVSWADTGLSGASVEELRTALIHMLGALDHDVVTGSDEGGPTLRCRFNLHSWCPGEWADLFGTAMHCHCTCHSDTASPTG
jgi:hypothetical protein